LSDSDQPASREPGSTRATAHLPGLEIEIVHRRSPEGDREQISIHMQAVPSFEAFEQYMRAMNPFALWLEVARLAWAPWLQAARMTTLPFVDSPRLTRVDPRAESDRAE
jgi:hypothetical protein